MNRLRNSIYGMGSQSLSYLFDRPTPELSASQLDYAEQIRQAFKTLPEVQSADTLPSEAAWLQNMNRLRELVLGGDLAEFLRWDVIQATMFVHIRTFVIREFAHLRRSSNWHLRWKPAIRENGIGHPPAFPLYPASSGNLIHHAYHAIQFEERTGLKLNEMDYVLEFGGGYGSMCRLFHQLGFRGRYAILDLPLFSELQKYYLRSMGLEVLDASAFAHSRTGVWCGSDVRELEPSLQPADLTPNTMFVATWSLSETPLHVRSTVIKYAQRLSTFLIAYQEKFGEVDNIQYFAELRRTKSQIAWSDWSIEHIPRNRYLMGAVSLGPAVRQST